MIDKDAFITFFERISETDYVVMRGFDNLFESVNNGEDIDILVSNKEKFVELTGAVPKDKESKFNYLVDIGGQEVEVDLRSVGDGYYDEKWEKNLLNSKIIRDGFMIPHGEVYDYSIVYHVLIHKEKISSKYYKELEKKFGTYSRQKLIGILVRYMTEHGYSIEIPIDVGVYYNKKNAFWCKLSQRIMI